LIGWFVKVFLFLLCLQY
jgi:citrate (Si)-synthase